jgi:polysaccharide deacetylase 2 family uncharacterized protein YibQ
MVMGSNLTGGLLADMQAFSPQDQHKVTKIEQDYISDVLAAKLKGDKSVEKLQNLAKGRILALTDTSGALRLNGFDRINKLADSLMAGTMTKEHMGQIRKLMSEGYKSAEDHVGAAEQLAKENGGVLKGMRWLQKRGHSGLVTAMYHHPEAFEHIKQESGRKSVEEQVEAAEKLAKANGGVLQCVTWLQKNGHSGLSFTMYQHPEAFAHIKRESKKGKSVQEQVQTAEKLAKANGGVLQCVNWLQKNGPSGLSYAMYKHPEAFAHIKQESKKGKSVQEQVETAEQLAKENGGVLHDSGWLKKNGHYGLALAKHKHPEAFKHIKQGTRRKSISGHMETAEKLAKTNGGVLQYSGWLKKNGHYGLDHAMRRYPEAFKHIIQEIRTNSGRASEVQRRNSEAAGSDAFWVHSINRGGR